MCESGHVQYIYMDLASKFSHPPAPSMEAKWQKNKVNYLWQTYNISYVRHTTSVVLIRSPKIIMQKLFQLMILCIILNGRKYWMAWMAELKKKISPRNTNRWILWRTYTSIKYISIKSTKPMPCKCEFKKNNLILNIDYVKQVKSDPIKHKFVLKNSVHNLF